MRLCFFGDSFVNGTGDDDCLGWPGRLCADARQRGHDVTLYNLGIRRDTSGDIAGRWEREASARLAPEHDGRLVFSFGVNDCVYEQALPRVAHDASVANTRTILLRAAKRWPTLMVGPPCTCDDALDARVGTLSERLEQACQELRVPYLPLFPQLRGNAVWRLEAEQGDGIHPNRAGYGLIAKAVLDWQPWRNWIEP